MKNSIKSLALAVGAIMVCSLVFAASGTQEAKTVTGVVKAVDVANQSLQMTEDVTKQEYTFKVEKTTVITKGGQTIALADIKTGDKVDVIIEQGKVKTVNVK